MLSIRGNRFTYILTPTLSRGDHSRTHLTPRLSREERRLRPTTAFVELMIPPTGGDAGQYCLLLSRLHSGISQALTTLVEVASPHEVQL